MNFANLQQSCNNLQHALARSQWAKTTVYCQSDTVKGWGSAHNPSSILKKALGFPCALVLSSYSSSM